MAKNDKIRLFSCCKYCSHWLSLSIVNSFLNWTDIFQIFAWLNTSVYIFRQPARFSHWLNLRKPWGREREYGEQDVCNIFLLMYVFIPAALVIAMSESILDTMNCDLQWTVAHPQYTELNFLRLRIVLILPTVFKLPFCGPTWWNKPRSRSEHSKILVKIKLQGPCGCTLWLYREVVVKLKPVCKQFVEREAKLPSGLFVQLSLFVVL